MQKSFLVRKVVTAILSLLVLTPAHAGIPLFSLIPLTNNHITVPVNGVKIIKYQVTNHSKKTHTLIMQPITGISQISTPGNCSNPLILGSQQSCILSLQINGNNTVCTAAGLPNIDTNLFQLGFGSFVTGYSYWTSTESSSAPKFDAWVHVFNYGTSLQLYTAKTSENFRYVRCVRAITF
ncbi:hypothetical protein J2N86_15085 (plasmid) [Legionella lytica]|uniref:Protein with a bacterial immunoglobulin-like domain protein n=1 Tax=Legionella lytica TaxID=96232 RepID=A0ABY4YDW4_9GAMM|nr:DUF1566 domain-containing protein [Legionella lytica]USQ15284.1 hypothetical protein J2N86_15085 [Legionella lytica]